MTYRIVADSSCDLRSYDSPLETLTYATVPLKIRVGQREFTDNAALDSRQMMDAMHNYNGPTSSACPSPEEWAAEFLKADCVLAITITSALSGSYNSALVARDMVLEEHPEKKIHVLDSLSAGGELVLIARKAASLLESGVDFEETCRQAELYAQKYQLLFVLANFDNLVKNGRMSRLVGFMAGAMNMRAVGIASRKGTLEMLHKTRGETRSLAFMLEEMDRRGFEGGPVVISHCYNENGAQMLARGIHAKWPESQVTILPTSGLCSYYAEEEGILMAF